MGKLLWEVEGRQRLVAARSCSFESRRTVPQGHGRERPSEHTNIKPEDLEVGGGVVGGLESGGRAVQGSAGG